MQRTRPRSIVGAALIGAVAVVVAVLALTGGRDEHVLHARFGAALSIAPGQEVRIAGSRVGEVQEVDSQRDGQALVTFTVDDEAWPLPASTRVALRWGSTTPYLGRFVQLVPGRESGPNLSDGATLAGAQVSAPVEFDQVYSIFDRDTRPQVRRFLASLGTTLDGREASTRSALDHGGDGITATASLFEEIGGDRRALRTLVATGARASRAIAREDPALRDIVSHAAATFDEFAAQTRPIQDALEIAPGTLERTQAGLRRVRESLPGLTDLVRDVKPGARQLALTAPALRDAAARLTTVAPLAASALRQARTATSPTIDLLTEGAPFFESTGRALRTAAPLVGCVRPYGPEIAGFFGTWGGYTSSYNSNGHYSRVILPVQPIPNGTPLNSVQTLATNPQLRYAFPRPPGLNAGQPWFQPQCGAGEKALDVRQDPEVTDPGADRE